MTTILIKGQINASAEKLWEHLENFDLTHFAGFPHTVEGTGVGRMRKFDMGKGEIAEQIEHIDPENKTLTYTVLYGPMPVQDYHSTIKVHDEGEATCELEWTAVFEPKDATEEEAKTLIEGMFLRNIKALNKVMIG